MHFERGAILFLLLLLIPAAYGLVLAERRRREALRLLVHASLLPSVDPHPTRAWVRVGLLVGAVGLLIVASAEPRRSAFAEYPHGDRDILIVVDTSLSMAAEDIRPSRIGFARETIRALLQRAQGERIGIIAFAGRAILQCPLTRDYAAVAMLAESLGPDLLPQPGTALRDALWKAIRTFPDEERRARLVLLMTDGEYHDANPERLASQLQRNGIRLFVLGIGTEAGAPIPLRDDSGKLTGYKRDRRGRLVSTRLNAAALREIADRAEGFYLQAEDGRGVEPLLDAMMRVTTAERRSFRAVPFALGLAALLLLLLERALDAIPAVGWRRLRIAAKRAARHGT